MYQLALTKWITQSLSNFSYLVILASIYLLIKRRNHHARRSHGTVSPCGLFSIDFVAPYIAQEIHESNYSRYSQFE